MPADRPTILATSGGIVAGTRTAWEFGPLTDHAIELAGVEGRTPRVCAMATAMGDSPAVLSNFYDAARQRAVIGTHLALFPMPNVEDVTEFLCEQDVIWVFGGSVAGLLAMWELHGLRAALHRAWQAGVVLTGVSAGSLCWHVGGTTDSFGPELRPVTNGLAFVPFSNGVHYDSEDQRRPLYQSLVADRTLPSGYATDDGVGVLYRDAEFVEAVSERDDASAWFLERADDGTVLESRIEPRRL
jgi:peptidase E